MKNIILSYYIVRDIEPESWKEIWDNLVDFGERMAPKLEPMNIKLKLRKVILDEILSSRLQGLGSQKNGTLVPCRK